jgi:DNA-binding NarL/FixJ family response regulator
MAFSQTAPRHIFLAEDDEDDRLLFSDALSEIDHFAVITHAENGKDLMSKLYLPDPLPEIIFLDLNMPIQNGYECLAEIRNSNTGLRNLRVIALTTNENKDNIDKVYSLGASYYIVKPKNFSALKAVISKALQMDWINETLQPERKNFVLSA